VAKTNVTRSCHEGLLDKANEAVKDRDDIVVKANVSRRGHDGVVVKTNVNVLTIRPS
jgi:hypothetical protein